jgi:hypothetical protein
MADGGTIHGCSILEADLQDVFESLLAPGQPMIRME